MGAAVVGTWVFGQRPFLPAGLGWVPVIGIKQHGHRLHPAHGVQTALPRGVKPGGLELQLVVGRHLDERTPAKCSLEACAEPERQERKVVFKWAFPSAAFKKDIG